MRHPLYGTRIILNDRGQRWMPRAPSTGIIEGETKNKLYWYVLLGDRVSAEQFPKNMVEIQEGQPRMTPEEVQSRPAHRPASEFKGRYVTLNEAGRINCANTLRHKAMDRAVILGENRTKTAWRLRWDGWATEQTLSKSWTTLLPEGS